MESKYYTPDISEFYVGFECEQYNDIEQKWESYIVSKYTWTSNGMWKMWTERPDSFRVKYLDKEDIESLGFEYTREDDYYLYFIKNEIGIQFMKMAHETGPIGLGRINIYDNDYPYADLNGVDIVDIFKGYIKNKSELKVLLKQLGGNIT